MGAEGSSMIIMIVLMFAIMYFLMIRPENKRKKKAQEMRDGLKKGDTVTTIGGNVGKIVHENKDTILNETTPASSLSSPRSKPRRKRRSTSRLRLPRLSRLPRKSDFGAIA